jgi:hypothetical protein
MMLKVSNAVALKTKRAQAQRPYYRLLAYAGDYLPAMENLFFGKSDIERFDNHVFHN